jgi:hypothetical protein
MFIYFSLTRKRKAAASGDLGRERLLYLALLGWSAYSAEYMKN